MRAAARLLRLHDLDGCWAQKKVPVRLAPTTVCHCCGVSSSIGTGGVAQAGIVEEHVQPAELRPGRCGIPMPPITPVTCRRDRSSTRYPRRDTRSARFPLVRARAPAKAPGRLKPAGLEKTVKSRARRRTARTTTISVESVLLALTRRKKRRSGEKKRRCRQAKWSAAAPLGVRNLGAALTFRSRVHTASPPRGCPSPCARRSARHR